ncbi:MAG: hypothetical protein WD770_02025 [Actinomycetota bacterium]
MSLLPAKDLPPRLIFLHVPKTGGLTLRWIMRRELGRRRVLTPPGRKDAHRAEYVRYLEEGGAPPLAPLREYVDGLLRLPPQRLAAVRGLVGHFWFGLHEELPGPSAYLTVLRDPIDRILSTYHHRSTRHGLSLSVEEYIRSERDVQMDNNQVRRLAATLDLDTRVGPCTPEMLARAKRNLERSFVAVGLTERYDEFLLLLRARLGWRRVTYERMNTSQGRPRREDLSAGALRILEDHNRHDLELLEHVRGSFDRQLAALDIDVERELERFRRRNAGYGRIAPLVRGARVGLWRLRHPSRRDREPVATA